MPAAVALLALCAQGCMLDWDRVWDAGPIADLPGLDKRPDVKPDAPSDPNNWVVALGGQKSAGGAAVSLDTDDKVFATGSFLEKIKNSTNTLPTQGKQDLLMAKLSSDGVLQWTVSAGGVDQERSYDILVSSAGERFVSGYFSKTMKIYKTEVVSKGGYDAVVIKLSPEGVHWMTSMGAKGADTALGLSMDTKGPNLWVTGKFGQTAAFGDKSLTSAGSHDLFVARLDPENGKIKWAIRAGGKLSDIAVAVALDKSGNAYVTGYFQGKATFGTFSVESSGTKDYDVYVAKIGATSDSFEWASSGGSSLHDEAKALAVDSKGNVYVTGYHKGPAVFGKKSVKHNQGSDLFVAKLDPKGTFLWVTSSSGSLSELGSAIAVDSQDRVVVAGYHQGSTTLGGKTIVSKGARDAYVASLDSSGETLWVVSGGGSKDDEALGLALDNADRPVVTGYFLEQATFGGIPIKAKSKDMYVWKFSLPTGGTP